LKTDERLSAVERSNEREFQPRLARLEQENDTFSASCVKNLKKQLAVSTIMSVDITKLQQEERELRARLSLAEANLSSFFVNCESAFSPPSSGSLRLNVCLLLFPHLAHTVQDQEVITCAEDPCNSSEVTFPPTSADLVLTQPPEPQQLEIGSEVVSDTVACLEEAIIKRKAKLYTMGYSITRDPIILKLQNLLNSHPYTVATPLSTPNASVFVPARVSVAASPPAHTVHDQDNIIQSDENCNSSVVSLPLLF